MYLNYTVMTGAWVQGGKHVHVMNIQCTCICAAIRADVMRVSGTWTYNTIYIMVGPQVFTISYYDTHVYMYIHVCSPCS